MRSEGPSKTQLSDRAIGIASAAGAAVLFGSAYVVTAIQLAGFTPLGAALWRSSLALAILVAVALVRARPRTRTPTPGGTAEPATPASDSVRPVPSTSTRLGPLLALGVLGGLVFIVGMNLAISHVGATITAFVAGLYAILAAVFAPFVLSEPLRPRALVGFVLALAGTLLLAELNPSAATIDGLAAGLVAAVSYGLYLVLIRRWSKAIDVGPVGISLVTACTSAVGLAMFLGFADPASLRPSAVTPSVFVATLWLGVVTAFGPLLATAALRRIEASLASSLLLLNPISATVLAVLLLGDWPSPVQLLGGVLVLVGIALGTDALGFMRRRQAERLEAGRQRA